MFFVLGDAVADLARMPECGTIDLAWSNLEQVAEYQTDASANAV